MNIEKVKGIIYTSVGAGCWGLSGCLGQYLFAEKNISVLWLVTLRLIVAGLILVMIGLALTRKEMFVIFKNGTDFKGLLFFSFFGILLSQMSFFQAIAHSNAGTATVIQSLSAIIILFYLCIKQLRFPTKLEVVVLLIAVFGVFLLTTGGDLGTMNLSFSALIYGLLSALGAALYCIISIDLMKKYGVYVTVGFGMLIAGFCLMFITKPWLYEVAWDTGTLLGVVGVIVVGTVFAYSFFLKGVSMVGSFVGGLLGNIEPVTAIFVSVVFLGLVFSLMEIIGIVLILATVLIISLDFN